MASRHRTAARRRDVRRPESAAGRLALGILTGAAAITLATVALLAFAVLTGRLPTTSRSVVTPPGAEHHVDGFR